MVSPIPIPEAARGVPLIATNEPVEMVILERVEDHFKQRVTGYVVVDPWFYQKLIECWNKNRK